MKSLPLALAVGSIVLVAFLAMRLGNRERNEVAQPETKELVAEPALNRVSKPKTGREANAKAPVDIAPKPTATPARDAPLGSVWLAGRFGNADGSPAPRIDSIFVWGESENARNVFDRQVEFDEHNQFEFEITDAFDARQIPTMIKLSALCSGLGLGSVQLDVRDVPKRRRLEARVTLEVLLRPDHRNFVVQGRVNCGGGATVLITAFDPSDEDSSHPTNLEQLVRSTQSAQDGTFSTLEPLGWHPKGRPETLTLLVVCDGWLPCRRDIQTAGGNFLDIGTLELARGETIRGCVPLAAMALGCMTVCATEMDETPIDALSAFARKWLKSPDYAACAETNARGEFELVGLMPSWYRLRLHSVPGLGDTSTADLVVRASATGVVMQPELCRVDVLVRREGLAMKKTMLEVRRRDHGSGFLTRRALYSDAHGRASAWIASDDITEIAIGDRVFPIVAGAPGGVIPLDIDL